MVFPGNGNLLVLNSPPTCIPRSYPVKSKANDQVSLISLSFYVQMHPAWSVAHSDWCWYCRVSFHGMAKYDDGLGLRTWILNPFLAFIQVLLEAFLSVKIQSLLCLPVCGRTRLKSQLPKFALVKIQCIKKNVYVCLCAHVCACVYVGASLVARR